MEAVKRRGVFHINGESAKAKKKERKKKKMTGVGKLSNKFSMRPKLREVRETKEENISQRRIGTQHIAN
jgi:hypothetical protein